MKKIFVMFLAVAFMSINLVAQNANSTSGKGKGNGKGTKKVLTIEQRADKRTAKLTEVVSLTADQTPKVKQAFVTLFTARNQCKQQNQGAENSKIGACMKEHRKTFDTTLSSILTKEQYLKYQAYKKEEHAKNNKPLNEDEQEETSPNSTTKPAKNK